MRKLFLFGMLWLSQAVAAPLPQAIKELDQQIQSQVKTGKAIGCAVAVVYQGKIIFIKAYGVKKKGQKAPVDLHTVFQLGSISKPITATLIAALQKQNLLSVKDAVSRYYPDVLPDTQVFHLLNHTSGYNRSGWNQKIEAGETRLQLLKGLAGCEQGKPGGAFDYHNLAYSLIEEVVASVCQQSFPEALKQRLFVPLKMLDTSVGFQEFSRQKNRAWPHQTNKENRFQPAKNYSHTYHDSVSAAGGINSSIQDMVTFLQVQMGNVSDYLSSEDLQDFHAPMVEAPDAARWFQGEISVPLQSYYGQGWRIIDYQQNRVVFHGGWLKGFRNFMGFMPGHDIGIVVLHNAENNFAKKTAMKFLSDWVRLKRPI